MQEYIKPDIIDLKKNPPEILKSKSTILNKEIYEYIEALINLDISVLDKNNTSEDIIRQLMELNFFKKLVIYNIYNKVKSLTENDKKNHILKSIHAFTIEYRDLERTELLKFIYDEMILNLYQEMPESIESRLERKNTELSRLKQRIENLEGNESLCKTQEFELISIRKKLQVLQHLTDNKIKKQYEIDKQECELQQIMLQKVLEENNLTLSDFEEIEMQGGKKFLIKKYPHASIYIKK